MAGQDQQEALKPNSALEYQGIGIRFVAILIDSIIGWILAFICTQAAISSAQNGMLPLILGFVWVVFIFAYYIYLEGSRGQTIGKMVVKIKVVTEDGGKISMKQAFIRNVLRIIDGIGGYLLGAILIWRSDKKQRLGDSIAKTVVVKA